MQYENNKSDILLSDPIPIKSLLEGKKLLCSLIGTSVKESDCYDAWKFVARQFENGSFHIQGIGFDNSYNPVAHSDSSRINISIAAMNTLTARILDVSNGFQNKNVPINERFCVSTPPNYLDWFDRSYSNVTINRYEGPFFPQSMDVIQGKKPTRQQWNQLLDDVVKIVKYKKITIDHAIYIKVFYDGTMSYIMVSTDDVLKNTNNQT